MSQTRVLLNLIFCHHWIFLGCFCFTVIALSFPGVTNKSFISTSVIIKQKYGVKKNKKINPGISSSWYTLNSQNAHYKKYMADTREKLWLDLGGERAKNAISKYLESTFCTIQISYHQPWYFTLLSGCVHDTWYCYVLSKWGQLIYNSYVWISGSVLPS